MADRTGGDPHAGGYLVKTGALSALLILIKKF
jgi:hypothetical protein